MVIKFQGDKNIQVIQNAAIAANFHECFQVLEHKYQTACHLLNEEVLLKVYSGCLYLIFLNVSYSKKYK